MTDKLNLFLSPDIFECTKIIIFKCFLFRTLPCVQSDVPGAGRTSHEGYCWKQTIKPRTNIPLLPRPPYDSCALCLSVFSWFLSSVSRICRFLALYHWTLITRLVYDFAPLQNPFITGQKVNLSSMVEVKQVSCYARSCCGG